MIKTLIDGRFTTQDIVKAALRLETEGRCDGRVPQIGVDEQDRVSSVIGKAERQIDGSRRFAIVRAGTEYAQALPGILLHAL